MYGLVFIEFFKSFFWWIARYFTWLTNFLLSTADRTSFTLFITKLTHISIIYKYFTFRVRNRILNHYFLLGSSNWISFINIINSFNLFCFFVLFGYFYTINYFFFTAVTFLIITMFRFRFLFLTLTLFSMSCSFEIIFITAFNNVITLCILSFSFLLFRSPWNFLSVTSIFNFFFGAPFTFFELSFFQFYSQSSFDFLLVFFNIGLFYSFFY